MKVFLNNISGIPDAIIAMHMSKRSWTPELDSEIRDVCAKCLDSRGYVVKDIESTDFDKEAFEKFSKWMDTLVKWGWTHTTLLRFVDISVNVQGLHRGGQDDWDSHAKRFDNRIIRSSTRLAAFKEGEMSDYYQGKIIPTAIALQKYNLPVPDELFIDGQDYVRTVNGYIRKDLAGQQDVERGLYMLSIPSDFIFKVNVTEFGHVYKERNSNTGANPEVKLCCERIALALEAACPWFTRDLLMKIKN